MIFEKLAKRYSMRGRISSYRYMYSNTGPAICLITFTSDLLVQLGLSRSQLIAALDNRYEYPAYILTVAVYLGLLYTSHHLLIRDERPLGMVSLVGLAALQTTSWLRSIEIGRIVRFLQAPL